MTDKGKGFEGVQESSERIDGERRGGKSGMESSLVMLTAVCHHVQQTFNFAENSGVANETAESGEHGHVVMLSEMQRTVK